MLLLKGEFGKKNPTHNKTHKPYTHSLLSSYNLGIFGSLNEALRSEECFPMQED